MYQAYWGFKSSPFSLDREGRGVHQSPAQQEALARLDFLVRDRQRLGLLVGDSGVGKSVMLGIFARHLRQRGHQVARIGLLGLDNQEFVWRLANELGEVPDEKETLGSLWRRIDDRLLVNQYQQVHTALLFDDADDAEHDILTSITRLAQWQPSQDVRLTVVISSAEDRVALIGRRLLELCELRIDVLPWEQEDTIDFLQTALTDTTHDTPIFDVDAMKRMHELTAGIPRRLRQIGELALAAGAGQQLATIDAETIDAVVAELSVAATVGQPRYR